MAPSLSAEEKNAQMRRERETLRQMLRAAQSHDFSTLQAVVEAYLHPSSSVHSPLDDDLTVIDVLSQFRDARKRTALHFACQSKEEIKQEDNHQDDRKDVVEQIIEWMFDQPPHPNKNEKVQKLLRLKDSEGLTPLMMAAQSGRARRVRALIEADERTSSNGKSTLGLARSKDGATALHYAAGATVGATTTKTLAMIYHAGPVALHTFSTMGGTPLHWACAAASSETLRDVPEEDEARILQRRHDVIQALLDLGADINAFRPPPALAIPPPLFLLMASTDDRLSHFFLSQHPQRNLQPSLDFVLTPVNATPVHMAADLNLVKSLQWLIRYYQELEARDRATEEDTTPSSSVSVFERLDFEGYTPLDMAAKEKHVECVRLLLQATQGNASLADAQDFIDNWNPRPPPTPSEIPTSVPPPSSRDSNDTVEGDAVEDKAKQDASQILLQRESISPEEADADEPKQAALQHKSRGNQYFSEQNWERAVDEYTRAIAVQPHEATLYSNRSAAYLAWTGHDEDALYDAVMAQTLQPTWPKAFYRVATARLAQQRYEDAAVAAWEGLQLDPENAELKELLQRCVQKGRREHQKKKKEQK
jgi:ankyrin repeat protein